MDAFALAIGILAVAFIAVSLLHLTTGLKADAMLGTPVPREVAIEPSFDSQNRFYGVTFSLLGVVLLIAATDLARYEPMIVAVLGVLFVAGIGRAIAWVLHGPPARWLIVILVADLVLPPVLFLWLQGLSI